MSEDLIERLRCHMGKQDVGVLLHDCREAADAIEAKDKEIERLRAADHRTSLLTVIANIREKTGVGGKPMLSELAAAIAEKITTAESRAEQAERALAEAVEILSIWSHDGSLQTFEHREKFRKVARAFVAQHGSDSREGK